jgi:hypothetical protein
LRLRRRRLHEKGLDPARVLADFMRTPMEVAQGALARLKQDEEG